MKRTVAMLFLLGAGCGPTPTPTTTDTRQSCRQLGWVCGLDDYGTSCGSCGAATCSHGTCSSGTTPPTCSCGGRVCGSDNCGNSCGTCMSGTTCSGGSCVTSSTMPTIHTLASGDAYFGSTYSAPFFLPVTTAVAFTATSTAGDTFNVGIWTSANWATRMGTAGARGYHARVSTTSDVVQNLPAGSYVLGFDCTNLIENCDVAFSVTATY